MIQAKNISKSFGKLKILKEVNVTIHKKEVVSIVGASGAGKTTLLHILGTLSEMDKNDTSALLINETKVNHLSNKALSKFRNENIGFIFQFHQLLPEFTALENVCIPAYIKGTPKIEAEQYAKELLNYLGLSERLNHKPNALSGGEQQRVAVARAMINKPKVIFADEPSGNLDSESAKQLHELFFKLRDTYDQTFVIVTHNKTLAAMTDRQLTMQDGILS